MGGTGIRTRRPLDMLGPTKSFHAKGRVVSANPRLVQRPESERRYQSSVVSYLLVLIAQSRRMSGIRILSDFCAAACKGLLRVELRRTDLPLGTARKSSFKPLNIKDYP
jgi:hypothetical protein